MDDRFRIEKEKVAITLYLTHGAEMPGFVFLNPFTGELGIRECFRDSLNKKEQFFPFLAQGTKGAVLVNRKNIV
ncbi:MAG: hypothetical protein HQK57_00205, partial [Deltaproteobacteria bacterium]|nr:hypothetical protein [Deltaproteobacteria bacterium]